MSSVARLAAKTARLWECEGILAPESLDQPNEYTLALEVLRLAKLAADPETLARRFHEAYERLAPFFGYETRRESAVPWESVPLANKRLMIAVAAEVLAASGRSGTQEQT